MSASDRENERYARQLDVAVQGLAIVTTNVSVGGAQLCCPEMRYRGFCSAERDGNIGLEIRLPGSSDWLRGEGRVRYADLCEDEYLIGFQFMRWIEGDAARWASYIETLSGTKTVA